METGAVGATCNPVIGARSSQERDAAVKDRILGLMKDRPTGNEEEIAWQLVREISIKGACLLKPVFDAGSDAHPGRNGRLSIQTDRAVPDPQAIVEQAKISIGWRLT